MFPQRNRSRKTLKCLLRHALTVHTSNKTVLLNCEIALSNFSNNRIDIAPLTSEELWAWCSRRPWHQQKLAQPKHELCAEWYKEKGGKKRNGIRLVNVLSDLKIQKMINDEGTLFIDFTPMTYSQHTCVLSCVFDSWLLLPKKPFTPL